MKKVKKNEEKMKKIMKNIKKNLKKLANFLVPTFLQRQCSFEQTPLPSVTPQLSGHA